ncbi:phage tail tape measure protein [Vibrio sp. 10N.261.55.A7]|uniref:phage tail tape measure protein n=1 Tax=Vibrio sp. 10N.261.55.A7 TaxID=1880851 RepID=UPI000C826A77|nr:phage tail tape measure protein [Vibrio sp. 10N.261.55.A7]PMJ92864.1 phage tail tape measure protein [Vibrio sp. 10N.261.55.A7]
MDQKLLMQMSLIDQVTKPLQGITKEMTNASDLGKKGVQNVGMGAAGIVAAGVAVQNALMPAIEMDRKLGEVASLGVVEDDLKMLSKTALITSAKYGKSATEMIAASYDIKSAFGDINGNELADITKSSAVLAYATKADAATITNYMGTMYGIFKNSADEMGTGIWSKQVAGMTAQSVEMFKTTGAGMSSAFTSVGANATAAGIAMEEQMAILGTLQSTMSGSEAGTKYRAFLGGVAKAQDDLGLSFTDSHGQMLPMLDILQELKGKYGETLSVAESAELDKAFGTKEATAMIKLLMADTDGLASSIDTLGQVQGMSKAEEMAASMTDQWERLQSTWFAVRAAVFGAVLPSINALVGGLADGMMWLTGWTEQFPWLTELLGYAAIAALSLGGVVAGLSLAMGIGQMVAGGWAVTLGVLKSVLVLTRFASLGLINGIYMLGAALLATPIGWFFLALGAAIAGVAYFWDDLKASFGDTAVFKFLSDTIDWVIDKLNMIPGIDIDLSSSGSPELEAATVVQEIERKPLPTAEEFMAPSQMKSNAQLPPQMVQNLTAQPTTQMGSQTHIGEVNISTEGGFTPEQMGEWEELSAG